MKHLTAWSQLLMTLACSAEGAPHQETPPDVELGGFTDAGKPFAAVTDGEWAPGGATTNTLLTGDRAFTFPAETVEGARRAEFFSGNSFFNQSWVEAPASTTAQDGLGPTFNARSCSDCHFKDGRGRPPEAGEDITGMLFRISIRGEGGHGEPEPDPRYGDQLQPFGVDGVDGEGRVNVSYEEQPGTYADGTTYSLRKPTYSLEDLNYGAPDPELRVSPRVAPQMIGLGLLDAIPADVLEAQADTSDANRDGISGRLNHVWQVEGKRLAPGRFGWKAEQPSVAQQVAGAFLGDMGLTSETFPTPNCTETQSACAESPAGGEPEVQAAVMERVVYYSNLLAPPARRSWETQELLRGKWLFHETGCAACHTPSHVTGNHAIPDLEEQTIWPYTDLLLHDLGEALSDNRPAFSADGAEWRTPPLWGIGLLEDVNGHELLLHDGRARGVAEAILWHGGEALPSQERFQEMDSMDRQALVAFVRSL